MTVDAVTVEEKPLLGRGDFIPGSPQVGPNGAATDPDGWTVSPDVRASRYLRSPPTAPEEGAAVGLPPGWGQTRRPWHLRRLSARLSDHKGHRWCGRIPVAADVPVVRAQGTDGRATGRVRYAQVQTCGQLWECAVCRTAELTDRARRLTATVAQHRETGGECYLLTLTMRRPRIGPTLDHCLWALRDSWESLADSAVWREIRQTQTTHYVRALEVTHGSTGWHAHLHILVYWPRVITEGALAIWRQRIANRWARAVDHHAGEIWRPRLDSVGCDLTPCSAARYLAKLGLEVASATSKGGRAEHRRSMWQVLDATAHVDAREREAAVRAWREYVRTMYRRKCLSASDDLADDMARVPSDVAVDVEIARMTGPTYRALSRRPEWLEAVARCLEEGRASEVAIELRAQGVRESLARRARDEVATTALDREREWDGFLDEFSAILGASRGRARVRAREARRTIAD